VDNIFFVIDKCREPYRHINCLERSGEYTLSLHAHPSFWQIIIVTDGSLLVEFGGRREVLNVGDIHILPPGCSHSLESNGYRQIGIDIAPNVERFDTFYRAFPAPTALRTPRITEYSRRIEELDAGDECVHELIFTLCDLILLTVARHDSGGVHPLKQRITDCVLSHPKGCRLDCAAAELYMSSAHLERKCRELFGMGFAALSARKRFELACVQLVSTEFRVADIGDALGFSEVSNFSAFFKRFAGVSPSEYRRRYLREK